MKKILFGIAAVALMGATACTNDDQPASKDVAGTVKNISGDAIANAEITVQNGDITLTTTSNSEGAWLLTVDQPKLTYTLTVAAEAYKTYTGVLKVDGSNDIVLDHIYTVLREPYLYWGVSPTAVKNAMISYAGMLLASEYSDELIYTGVGEVLVYDYEFENGVLDWSTMYVAEEEVNDDTILDFFDASYEIIEIDEEDYSIYWLSTDGKTIAVLTGADYKGQDVWVCMYTSSAASARKANGKLDLKKTFGKRFEKINPDKEKFYQLQQAAAAKGLLK